MYIDNGLHTLCQRDDKLYLFNYNFSLRFHIKLLIKIEIFWIFNTQFVHESNRWFLVYVL